MSEPIFQWKEEVKIRMFSAQQTHTVNSNLTKYTNTTTTIAKKEHYCHIMIKLLRNRNIQSDDNRNVELVKRPRNFSSLHVFSPHIKYFQ